MDKIWLWVGFNFWGVIGALLMRGAMIGAGAYLIKQFHWRTLPPSQPMTHVSG